MDYAMVSKLEKAKYYADERAAIVSFLSLTDGAATPWRWRSFCMAW